MIWSSAVLKYLRIAVTAVSLTACVLLIALWVRSYTIVGANGGLLCSFRNWDWKFTSHPLPNLDFVAPKFRWLGDDDGFEVFVPHWWSILVSAAIAAAPWIVWFKRFTL